MRRWNALVSVVGCALAAAGCAASGAVAGPAATANGYDIFIAHDGEGELTIVPESGLAFRQGSPDTEQVRVEWTTEHDVGAGRMLVWDHARRRLLASLDATAVVVRHESGDPFQFSLAPKLNPHAAPRAVPAEFATSDAPDAVDDADDEVAYAPWDETAGRWNRAPGLE